MNIIDPSYEILDKLDREAILKKIEACGRVCYKSEGKAQDGSAGRFVRALVKNGHESVLEHVSFSVRFIVDRGVSHEIVRHRLASYSQESQRYCNYANEEFDSQITVIRPFYLHEGDFAWQSWVDACEMAEEAYFNLMDEGLLPEEARAVLPNCTKTEIVMTANLREWRHFFKLRTSRKAHPQMRQITLPLYNELATRLPEVFENIVEGVSAEK